MADNFLEKHYAEYEARKVAWQNSGAKRSKSHPFVFSISSLNLPVADFDATKEFYCSVFGFVESENNILSGPNGEFILVLFEKKNENFIRFTLKMASKYQYEQLIKRLIAKNIKFLDDKKSLIDPSGNIVVVEL